MPTRDHYGAIMRWRQGVDRFEGGLASFQGSAAVSTMLFGCRQWLAVHASDGSPEDVQAIVAVHSELERWMMDRGLDPSL